MRGFALPTSASGRRYAFAGLIALFIALLPTLAACGPGSDDSGSLSANQTLTWPYLNAAAISSAVLDPGLVTFAADGQNAYALYSGLVTYDSSLNVVPDAAASMPDISGDGTIYTFHLRQDLKWSDGTQLTASDFAYAIDRALDPHLCTVGARDTYAKSGACSDDSLPGAAYLTHIIGATARAEGQISSIIGQGTDPKKGVDVVDPYTLQINLDSPVAYFLESLTYSTSFPVEKSLVQKYPNGTWVQHLNEGGTNGPLKIASYQTGQQQSLVMVPNPNWSRPGVPAITLKQVVRPLYDDADKEYDDYRAGTLDFTDVPGDKFFTARGQSDFYEVGTLATTYFGFNMTQAPFQQDDPNAVLIRQAMDLALNKQLIVDRVENGASSPTNHIVPRGMPGYNDGLTTPEPDATQSVTGNQEAAQSLIKKALDNCAKADPFAPPASCAYLAKTDALPINLYVTKSNNTRVSESTAAAQQWNTVLAPLHVNVQQVDRATFGGNFYPGGPYQMWIIGWLADYPDPQDFISLQFACGSNANYGSYCDHDLDTQMKKADQETDQTARLKLYNQIEQTVVNASPWIPIEQPKYSWRQKSWVRGFGVNPLQLVIQTTWANVKILEH